jgi:hypothetical protein
VIPLELLPRRCPLCDDDTIIGHGRRLRQCHDDRREDIWVRRGICEPCKKTFTILPDWLAPFGHYSLHCRQQAAPHCKDVTRLPDPSTVRRWAQRRLISVWSWIKIAVKKRDFLRTPTISAWDLSTLCRILPIEARSP